MENYIVRIYRRGQKAPGDIAGIIEIVATDEKKVFADIDELKEIIVTPNSTKRGDQA